MLFTASTEPNSVSLYVAIQQSAVYGAQRRIIR